MTADESMPTARDCGTMVVHERLLRTDPAYVDARVRSENRAFAARMADVEARTGVTVIPVVVHVVSKTAAQNISDAQVRSQIDVLNRDFRKRNTDISRIPEVFRGAAADARIEFVLATRDPNGAPTSGITRTTTNVDAFTDDDRVKSAATGGANAWPADRYLNIWTCQLAGSLLGYAQFPGGAAATDGVVIRHSAFGTTGTATAPFNLGRTATHEVGHYLNLRHIWGDDGTGCNGDDFVADTPNAAGPNTGKPAFPHVTCSNGPNGDMFMNYMDYTDDDSMFMFTGGQVMRMQTCLDGDRRTLGTTKAGSTGRPPGLAAFSSRLFMEWKGITGDQAIWWSSFNGTAWAAQQRVPGVGTSVGPSLAVFDNRLYAAWKGIEGDQAIYWSSFNGTAWAPQQRIAGVGTSVGPSLAVFNGRLHAAWKGIEGDQGIYWSSFDGTAWAPQQRVAGVGTSVGPSLAVFNNRLYAAWKGIQGDQGIYWSSFNGTAWAPQQRVAGVGTSVGPALAVFNNRLYATWKGIEGDQGIYWSSFNGTTWAAQQRVPGVGTGPQGREDGDGDGQAAELAAHALVASGTSS